MKFFLTLAVALFPALLVNAQSTSGSYTQINVQVSPGGQLVYSPSNFTAKNGTIVTFSFPNSYHSVTQGDFAKPCAYLAASGGSPAGFDSGLLSGTQFSLNITNDKDPIFFFCKTRGHCGLGMVGAINVPTTGGNTYAAYLTAAKALGSSEPVISNTGAATGGVGATAVSSRAVSSSSSATTSRSSSSGTSSTPRSSASGASSAPRSGASSAPRSGASSAPRSGASSAPKSGASEPPEHPDDPVSPEEPILPKEPILA